MSTGLRDLKLWQEATALAGDVSRAARVAARRETGVLTDRLILAGCAVPESVADAHGRYDLRDQQRAYRSARRALLVLETDLAIARHAELLSAPVLAQLSGRTAAVGRLLAGYLAFLERQIDAAESSRAESSRAESAPTRDACAPCGAAPVDEVAESGGPFELRTDYAAELDSPARQAAVFVEP